MKRRTFLQQSSLAMMALATNRLYAAPGNKTRFRFQLWRHATLFVEVNKINILVDPMLSAKDAMNPIPNAANSLRIPMVDLPFNEVELKKKLATRKRHPAHTCTCRSLGCKGKRFAEQRNTDYLSAYRCRQIKTTRIQRNHSIE